MRDEAAHETRYRVELPAGMLGIAPGTPFRFNLQLNDNDGRCRVGYLSLTDIRDDGRDDSGFPVVSFEQEEKP